MVLTHFALAPSNEFLPERVSLLYRLAGSDAPAILLTSAVAAFALWGYVADSLLAAWLIWLVFASLVRYALAHAWKLSGSKPQQAARWEGYFCLVSALLGAIWGLTVMLLYPSNGQMRDALTPFLIGSVAMGLPATLAPSPKVFACFITPILAPLVGLLFSQGGAFNASAALLILVFTVVLFAFYLSSHRALVETLRFGKENEALLYQAKVTKERLDLALRVSDLVVWEWDARRGTVLVDGSWRSVLGERTGTRSLTLAEIERLAHPEDAPRVKREIGECLSGAIPEYIAEHRVRSLAGDWRWSTSRGRVVERDSLGAPLRMTGFNLDIELQKRAEAELLAAIQREKELTEMKSKFVSIASHEFRTPLATILSSVELLDHHSARLGEEERSTLLQTVRSSVKRMSELIDDVLALGRAESGVLKLNPAPLDLRALCRRVADEIAAGQGREHRIGVEDHFDRAEVQMDEKLLRHILGNLLSNAVKYSPPGSEVTLRLARQGDTALIEVEDRGIGIPEKDQPRLFESFHRASNVDNRPGTGLGLAIVKKSVELHGGEIRFQTQLGKGTRFIVSLPLRCPKQRAAEAG